MTGKMDPLYWTPIVLRPMDPAGDRTFVLDSWIRSYADSPWARLAGASYRHGHDALVKRLLRRAPVLVACFGEDTATILGWACTEIGVVHYVYVKRDVRKRGIARMLLASFRGDEDVRYTHMLPGKPGDGEGEWRVPRGWSFDPYALFYEA